VEETIRPTAGTLLEEPAEAREGEPDGTLEAVASASGLLRALILSARRSEAGDLLRSYARGRGCGAAIAEVLEPVLRQLGELWAAGGISLAQGYVAGKVAEDMLSLLDAGRDSAIIAPRRGVAVIGNVEDDFHGLGRRLVGSFLGLANWDVRDLGNDVLAPRFVDAAIESGASVIGVSAMMLTNARNVAKVRDEIEARGLGGRIMLAVGGAVFAVRPELVTEVGGDGTCATAMEAPALFESLTARVAAPAR